MCLRKPKRSFDEVSLTFDVEVEVGVELPVDVLDVAPVDPAIFAVRVAQLEDVLDCLGVDLGKPI